MKIEYLNKERAEKAKLAKKYYEVLAYGQQNSSLKTFLFPNDELEIYDMDQSSVKIIDKNLSEYKRIDELNGGRELYVKSDLIKYLSEFKSIYEIKSAHLWNKSKIAEYFVSKNYEIPKAYRDSVLNETYKLNLIQGFLKCVNQLLIYKNGESNLWEEFYFSISDTELGYLRAKPKFETQQEIISIKELESTIVKFAKDVIPEAEEKISDELFKLIDSIFMKEIKSLKKIYNWSEEVICVGYGRKYYSLRKFRGS